MNKLNFIKADKPDCSNATDSEKITVTVREFITTTLAEKIATALWNKPESVSYTHLEPTRPY